MRKSPFFKIFKVTLWPWPWLKVILNCMLGKVLPQTTFGPSLVTLLQLVSEISSMFKFGTDGPTVGRTVGRRTPEGHFIDSLRFTREPKKETKQKNKTKQTQNNNSKAHTNKQHGNHNMKLPQDSKLLWYESWCVICTRKKECVILSLLPLFSSFVHPPPSPLPHQALSGRLISKQRPARAGANPQRPAATSFSNSLRRD